MGIFNEGWEEKVDELEGEIGRLRVKLARTQAESAERFARLSDANAILREMLTADALAMRKLLERARDHLANQPAAPTRAEGVAHPKATAAAPCAEAAGETAPHTFSPTEQDAGCSRSPVRALARRGLK